MAGGTSKIRAFFDVETSEGITVKGFKIAEGTSGLFVGMPSEKGTGGKWWDKVVMPKELKDELGRMALAEYSKVNAQQSAGGAESTPGAPDDMPF